MCPHFERCSFWKLILAAQIAINHRIINNQYCNCTLLKYRTLRQQIPSDRTLCILQRNPGVYFSKYHADEDIHINMSCQIYFRLIQIIFVKAASREYRLRAYLETRLCFVLNIFYVHQNSNLLIQMAYMHKSPFGSTIIG